MMIKFPRGAAIILLSVGEETMKKISLCFTSFALAFALLTGCEGKPDGASGSAEPPAATNPDSSAVTAPPSSPSKETGGTQTSVPGGSQNPGKGDTAVSRPPSSAGGPESMQVVANPESIDVLVNKQHSLPSSFEPKDLVYPDVPFTFKEKIEKREMRREAAEALEKLFAGAKKDGIYLAGVSGYRSYATQKALFDRYVKQDGEEKAKTYSAVPGTSEHETGLAIDVSGSDGKCAAQDCFAGTKEAVWLEKHAPEYGFIIRYPKGKESITGYQYEPWHIRYVGTKIAREIADKGITLEEYFNAVPVSK
jgi:D-alanyl-D-alanine carboxypeptidase